MKLKKLHEDGMREIERLKELHEKGELTSFELCNTFANFENVDNFAENGQNCHKNRVIKGH